MDIQKTKLSSCDQTSSGLCAKLSSYMVKSDIDIVYQAYLLALKSHDGQMRKSGDAYISHPVEVAMILADLKLDVASICSALLHDCIEDTSLSKEEIQTIFGLEVANIVDGVTKLDHLSNLSLAQQQAENFRKLFLAMSSDIRVILIKLSDRLHNMRTISAMSIESRKRIAKETLEIHAPIAHRLGLNHFKSELEELAFKTLYPYRYQVISNHIAKKINDQEAFIKTMKHAIEKRLREDSINASIIGRTKDSYSIFCKMRTNHLRLKEVFDVYAFRLIVDKLEECYLALGSIHNLYKPLPGRFKDYIALPKENGYQSLHTVLFAQDGTLVEVQIRSKAMDFVAQRGIAAHWRYKENSSNSANIQPWVNDLIEIKERTPTPVDFLEAIKHNLTPNEVFVFSPKGDIIQLPYKSTIIDFAYAVHTDIGNHCVSAKVDKRKNSLNTLLKSGQTIEIITHPKSSPEPEWLDFVITTKAKLAIQSALKKYAEEKTIEFGRNLLDSALLNDGFNQTDIATEEWQACLDYLSCANQLELFLKIGTGEVLIPVVMNLLIGEDYDNLTNTITLKNMQHLVVNFAQCCHPIPGDKIIGVMGSSGKGVTIHRQTCSNIDYVKSHQPQWIHLDWGDEEGLTYTTLMNANVENRRGVLANIMNAIAALNINVEDMVIKEKGNTLKALIITLSVKNLHQLNYVFSAVRQVEYVKSVVRE